MVVARGPGRVDEAGEHVAFARALVAVSARYLAHCEDQADEHVDEPGGLAVSTMTDDVMGLGWVPAPGAGSAARKAWPRTARLAWSLARRPLLPLTVAAWWPWGSCTARWPRPWRPSSLAAGLSVWEHVHPASFDATAGRVLRGSWRSAWTYGLRWRASMMFAGLGGRFDRASGCPGWCGCGRAGTAIGSRSGWWWANSPPTGNAAPMPWRTRSGPARVGSSWSRAVPATCT